MWFLLALVLFMGLPGCGPRPGAAGVAAAATASASDRALVVDLPALYIDYDGKGIAYLGDTRLADLGAALGRDLSRLDVGEPWVTRLMTANIQHLQLLNTPAGVVVLVNGEAMPSLGWDATMLTGTAQLFQAMGEGASLVGALLPLVPDFGLGLVVRFPLASEAVPIPLADAGNLVGEEVIAAAGTQTAQAAYLALIGAPPELLITVDYAVDGTWTVAGMNATAWTQVVNAPWDRLTLPPALVQNASAAGIKTVTITSNHEGLFVVINAQPLPYIRWANGEINKLIDLAQQLGLLGALDENPNADVILATVQNLLPFVQTLEVKLVVNFP